VSKLIYFDFRCLTCDLKSELLVKSDAKPPCPSCGGDTKRLISAPTIGIDGKDPSFPGEYERWDKKRIKKAKEDAKFYADHGSDKLHHNYGS